MIEFWNSVLELTIASHVDADQLMAKGGQSIRSATLKDFCSILNWTDAMRPQPKPIPDEFRRRKRQKLHLRNPPVPPASETKWLCTAKIANWTTIRRKVGQIFKKKKKVANFIILRYITLYYITVHILYYILLFNRYLSAFNKWCGSSANFRKL